MKILHLSAASELTGAGKATLLTHNALLKARVQSKVLFLKSDLNAREVFSYHKLGCFLKMKRQIITLLERFPVYFYPNRSKSIFSTGLAGLKLKNNPFIKWADVIHIHWANHGYIDIAEIKKWNKPVVWTLRDMWAFTGGCHYAFDCENFKKSCGNCPVLGSSREKDLSRFVLQSKLKHIQHLNINWIAISSWMQKEANESALLKDKFVAVVHSGVDASKFCISDKEEIRTKLKLPLNKAIILLGADSIRERSKGFEYAKGVLNKMKADYLVVTFGNNSFHEGEIPQQTIHFGQLDYEQLCELYNAADVFLGPSIAEAMGKTFLEAQLCGLPVVCFAETGPADIVNHKETGYLAKYKDVDDLLHGLEFCLNTKMDRRAISSRATELFDITQIVKAYIAIYEKSIVDWANSSTK